MKQTVIAATAAALLASVTFGIAASGPRAPGPDVERPRPSPQQMAENASAMSDARIAALKAGLRMTAEQEKLWPALEAALKDTARQRIDHRMEKREERADRRGPGMRPGDRDPVAGLSERADDLIARGEVMKKLADAAGPLYQSLDDGQKHRFNLLFREARGERRFAFNSKPGWGQEMRGPHRHHGPQGGPPSFGPRGPGQDGHRLPPPPQGERL